MTISWKIENMERRTSDGFVTAVHWRVTGEDDGFSATACGSVGFEGETPEVAFNSLTEAGVLAWVWANGVDKAAYEASIGAQIEAQKHPVKINGIPW
jgi:hypothetical protein